MIKFIRYLLIITFLFNNVYILDVNAATINTENYLRSTTVQLAVSSASDVDTFNMSRDDFAGIDYVRVCQLSTPSYLRIVDTVLNPVAPSSLAAETASASRINLTWQDNSNNETGFKIERAVSSTGPWSQIGMVLANVTIYASTGLSASTTYHYRVRAYNTSGDSIYSNKISAKTQEGTGDPPNAPSSLKSTSYSTKLVLSWQDNSNDETCFEIERAPNNLGPWDLIATVGANVTTYTDSSVTFSTSYVYRVSACNTGACSSYSGIIFAYTQPNHPPEANNDSAITMKNTSVSIDVTRNDFDVDDNLNLSSVYDISNPGDGTLSLFINDSGNSIFTYTPKSNFIGEDSFMYEILDTEGEIDTAEVYITVSPEEPPGGNLVWAKVFGSVETDRGISVAVDSENNVIMLGTSYRGEVKLYEKIVHGVILVTKFSPKGQLLWAKGFGSEASSTDVAVDKDDNIIITGNFKDGISFGGDSFIAQGEYPVFVAKFSKEGNHLWSKGLGLNTRDNKIYGVAVDSMNNVLIAGRFTGTLDLGKGALTSNNSSDDIFVAKYNGDTGQCLWAKRFGDYEADAACDIAVDSDDNIVITGKFTDTINFGAGRLYSTDGSPDIFVTKLRGEDSVCLWSWQYGTTNSDWGLDVGIDPRNNDIVVDAYSINTYNNINYSVLLLAKLSDNNLSEDVRCLWSKSYELLSSYYDLVVDSEGDIIITATANKSIDLGGGPLAFAGINDIFVAKYSETGQYKWAKTFGSTLSDYGIGITVDHFNNIVSTGSFQGTVDFGTGPLTCDTDGLPDIFLIKMEP